MLLGNGSLDFDLLVEIKVFSTKPPKSLQLFAGGSTATKFSGKLWTADPFSKFGFP